MIKFITAIDFGTSRSGYAYSLTTNNIDSKNEKTDFEIYGPTYQYGLKTDTAILFKPRGNSSKQKIGNERESEIGFEDLEFELFGTKAITRYRDLHEDDLAFGYELFTDFKMNLYREEETVVSYNGMKAPLFFLIKSILVEIKKQVLENISRNPVVRTPFKENEILWLISVPAIWKEEYKYKMRVLAKEAGLILPKGDEDRLFVIYEPEAAGIDTYFNSNSLKAENNNYKGNNNNSSSSNNNNSINNDNNKNNNNNNNNNNKGNKSKKSKNKTKSNVKALIVDAGGGTVDITAVELSNNSKNQLELLLAPRGVPIGSTKVDQYFLEFISQVLGQPDLTQSAPLDFIYLMEEIENIKIQGEPDWCNSEDSVGIEISEEHIFKIQEKQKQKKKLVQQLKIKKENEKEQKEEEEEEKELTLEELVEKFNQNNQTIKLFIKGRRKKKLMIPKKVIYQFFEKPLKKLVQHLDDLLVVYRDVLSGVDTIVLVGGFSQSKIFRDIIERNFGKLAKSTQMQFDIKYSNSPCDAVLRGAVKYGKHPSMISFRKYGETVGFEVCKKYNPEKHYGREKILIGKEFFVDGIFQPVIWKEQKVKNKFKATFKYGLALNKKRELEISIFKTLIDLERDREYFIDEKDIILTKNVKFKIALKPELLTEKEKKSRVINIEMSMVFKSAETSFVVTHQASGEKFFAKFDFNVCENIKKK
ncbi:alpha kinase/elongation factor 2 kinase [Anaeramoeba flamelloides]|uniref:Alpha kinase/elongation factor 2 kinase n=1 Tax=Anaeramoeba flamelloides TaxID=1746091 RepID=A0ABQ8YHA1_9EUKA|nr:alpha kinase/elongation factor 2 kinase [Anaeramoeba flamelloides]